MKLKEISKKTLKNSLHQSEFKKRCTSKKLASEQKPENSQCYLIILSLQKYSATLIAIVTPWIWCVCIIP